MFGTAEAIFHKSELFVSIAAVKHQILHYSVKRYWKLFKYAPAHCKRVGFAGLGKMTKTKSLPFKRLFQSYYKHTGNLCVG